MGHIKQLQSELFSRQVYTFKGFIILEIILCVILIVLASMSSEFQNIVSKIMIAAPFICSFYISLKTPKSYIFRYGLTKNFDRKTVLQSAFLCAVRPIFILIPVVIITSVISHVSLPLPEIASAVAADILLYSCDFALFLICVFATSFLQLELLTFISPLIPFAAELLPHMVKDVIKIGYITPIRPKHLHSFSESVGYAGGALYFLQTVIIIVVIFVLIQKHFCNKDL